ncbi:unnamed protein product [Anisakis simplex]|uniref:Ribonucleases P/MRP protein subunit POP1 (inferred by orthology to a human protein) n=1 Tax=Anisakis simplex TaxID=6269 RepID=A0A0M3J1W1_ANISI|nr:unnamed protein product [Anisakis simplex]
MEENEITDRAENGNGQMEEEGRPRDINIVHNLKAIENRSLVSGEVTKGPRTALQRLPRHMRRRAMSYNIKRFPRNQRRFAASAVKASKHRKKAPSRFWRRRPRNLLLNYIRRQRKHIWLETHVWHAKRFYMCDKWGYRLALRSYQRAYRATYRDAMRHCTIRDTSFIRCFQVNSFRFLFCYSSIILIVFHSASLFALIFCGGNENDLISALRSLCVPSASATFAFKSALENRFEITTLLFEPGKYPFGFIGPVRFCWTGERALSYSIVWSDNSLSLMFSIQKDEAPINVL